MINLLNNTPYRPFQHRTKNLVEINDYSRGTYNTNSRINFKIEALKLSLCDCSDAYILVSGPLKNQKHNNKSKFK